ncbi:MAG: hypothetical protein GF399_00980 [Candidatus Coatesbacteria bacterium]|nr:hypothetical protein [Candidatus Coatesbacteria bacterium]
MVLSLPRPAVSLTLLLGLAVLTGCEGGTGSGDGDGDDGGDGGTGHGLAWALDKADPIRDAEMPDALLHIIFANALDGDGQLTDDAEAFWHFTYVDSETADELNGLDVTVYCNGLTTNSFNTYELTIPLPAYTTAYGWIEAADAALPDEVSINERQLLVVPNYLAEWFEVSDNLAYVLYRGGDDEGYDYLVAVDADSGTVNNVFDGAQLQFLLDLIDDWFPEAG